ncbi:hypothetical protein, partial [Escherichia coli]|uniref:hypothetical protein n=1 Tax=Escherichia coli TaxID=562 RepID=UPI001BC88E9D
MPNHDRFECQTVIDLDAILHLHKKYSKARLNAACARALKTKVWRLSGIKSILEKGLDKQPV